jgi:hypothetical protein
VGTAPSLVRESEIQRTLWDYLTKLPVPEHDCYLSDLSFHPPNGVWIPGDPRASAKIINSLRGQGFKTGVSDLVIAYPLHGWHGAFIELKKDKKSRIEDDQKVWLKRMRACGYFTELCIGLDAGIEAIQRYLAGHKPLGFPWKEKQTTVVDSSR